MQPLYLRVKWQWSLTLFLRVDLNLSPQIQQWVAFFKCLSPHADITMGSLYFIISSISALISFSFKQKLSIPSSPRCRYCFESLFSWIHCFHQKTTRGLDLVNLSLELRPRGVVSWNCQTFQISINHEWELFFFEVVNEFHLLMFFRHLHSLSYFYHTNFSKVLRSVCLCSKPVMAVVAMMDFCFVLVSLFSS